MKRYILVCCFALFCVSLFSQKINKNTYTFAVKDDKNLNMDVYFSEKLNQKNPCLIFVFGGGFKEGSRDSSGYLPYFNHFAEKGFVVVSIDYRLGMKNQKAPGIFDTKPIENSIKIAVEDLYDATNYILNNSDKLKIDKKQIIISGSSAGAITVLQADYEDKNNTPIAKILPRDFDYAGVISFAGGIFSTKGIPKYVQRPASTLFFHGSADKLVPYNKMQLFNKGMFGSNSLVKRFKENGYPFTIFRMIDIGHEVSEYPMTEFLPEIDKFISDFIFNKKPWMIDVSFKNPLRKSESNKNPKEYYN